MPVLLVLLAVNLALAVAPIAIVLPFQAQAPWMLWASFTAKSASPVVAVLSLIATGAIVWSRWSNWGRWRRALACGITVLLAGSLVLGRTNLVEVRFAAAPNVDLASIDQFRDISAGDMVIGVTIGGISRAYPVRYLAYHHLVNDRIGSTVLLPNY